MFEERQAIVLRSHVCTGGLGGFVLVGSKEKKKQNMSDKKSIHANGNKWQLKRFEERLKTVLKSLKDIYCNMNDIKLKSSIAARLLRDKWWNNNLMMTLIIHLFHSRDVVVVISQLLFVAHAVVPVAQFLIPSATDITSLVKISR